jgi:hypothetical protein
MLLGAMVPRGGQTWFFKMVGPPELLQSERENFRQFIHSLRFPSGDKAAPVWTVPDGWTQEAGSGMRYATLQIGAGERAAELTVIGLPNPDEDEDSYLLANVNRWREQLQLPSIDREQLDSEAEVIPLDETKAMLVRMQGIGSGRMQGRVATGEPRASAMPPNHPVIADTTIGASHQQNSPELKYTAPDGWTETTAGGLRKAAFSRSRSRSSILSPRRESSCPT